MKAMVVVVAVVVVMVVVGGHVPRYIGKTCHQKHTVPSPIDPLLDRSSRRARQTGLEKNAHFSLEHLTPSFAAVGRKHTRLDAVKRRYSSSDDADPKTRNTRTNTQTLCIGETRNRTRRKKKKKTMFLGKPSGEQSSCMY